MDPPQHHDDPPQVQPGVVCRVCGYDLHGLEPQGNCPECGAPIAFSIRGDLYRFTDPHRLDRMALGATIIAGTLLVCLPLWIGLNFLDNGLRSMSRRGLVVAIGTGVWLLAHALGWWMLTEREPSAPTQPMFGSTEPGQGAGPKAGERARVWVREAVATFVLASLGALLTGLWRGSAWGIGSPWAPGRKLGAALWLAAIVAGVGVLLTGLRYMMAMGRRLPPGKLATRAEFLFLFIATISVMMAVSALIGGLFYGLGMPEAVGLLGSTCGCMSVPLWAVAVAGVMVASHTAATSLRTERDIGLALRQERERTPLP